MTPANKKICVFCSSSDRVPRDYLEMAENLGQRFGPNGWHLVYGGGKLGLMGRIANGALRSGADVTGVMPNFLVDKEVAHTDLTELIITNKMQERQAKMAALSDIFIVLPGGLGTLAEFFEIITMRQLSLSNQPVIIFNYGRFWGPLFKQFNDMHQNGFLYKPMETLVEIADSIQDIENLIAVS